jgi:hypothetical protein
MRVFQGDKRVLTVVTLAFAGRTLPAPVIPGSRSKCRLNGLAKALYRVHTDLFRDYLRAELASPHVIAF